MMATNNTSSDRMSAAAYRKAIEALRCNQTEAAELLGVDERTSRRWANDEREIPAPVARFLRYLVASKRLGASVIEKLK